MGVGKGWDRYRLGHPAVEVLAQAPPLNVQSGHSKDRAVDGTTPLKGGRYKVVSVNQSVQHHRNPSCGNLRRPHWTWAYASIVVERVPPQGALAL